MAAVLSLAAGNEETYWPLVFFKALFYGFHTNLLVYTLVVGLVEYVDRVRSLADGERRAAELEAQLAAGRRVVGSLGDLLRASLKNRGR